MTVVYDQAFFDLIRPGVQRSAAALVPWLLKELAFRGVKPKTMVDVGCGEGWWAAEFAEHGLTVDGIDGIDGGGALDPSRFLCADLAKPLSSAGLDQYDLALSLEVAEHLPLERADSFVADLCQLAPVVVFSAAVPDQPGHGHVNCQWQDWWARLFEDRGYRCDDGFRWPVWNDDRIEWWYRQNLFVAWHPDAMVVNAICNVKPVVHPAMWEFCR